MPKRKKSKSTLKKKSPSLTGSTSANFHEGTRSEYLAHYVLASFGTAVPVPSREDTGLDLLCTLTERIGQLIWPAEYYSVQVKSTDDSWCFGSKESIEWFVKYPQPIFLCVVNKSEARLSFFHTLPRFSVWANPMLPKEITLIPGKGDKVVGAISGWDAGTSFCLGIPILDFTIQDAADRSNIQNYADVLKSWIQIEKENLFRITSNVRAFRYPKEYITNVPLEDFDSSVSETNDWKRVEKNEDLITQERLRLPLTWLTYQLAERGDIAGAIMGSLLLRHLSDGEIPSPLLSFHAKLTATVGGENRAYAGIDNIAEFIQSFAQDVATSGK